MGDARARAAVYGKPREEHAGLVRREGVHFEHRRRVRA